MLLYRQQHSPLKGFKNWVRTQTTSFPKARGPGLFSVLIDPSGRARSAGYCSGPPQMLVQGPGLSGDTPVQGI